MALRRVHRGVLAAIGLCALAIAMLSLGGDPAEPDPQLYSLVALGLAMGSILIRRTARPELAPRRSATHAVASLLLAGGLGLLGVVVTVREDAGQVGLLYALAGALLALRPPPRLGGDPEARD